MREHMNFIISLLLAPDFKTVVNWHGLRKEDVNLILDDSGNRIGAGGVNAIEDLPAFRNFIILTALKI